MLLFCHELQIVEGVPGRGLLGSLRILALAVADGDGEGGHLNHALVQSPLAPLLHVHEGRLRYNS